ncbi:MAG: MucB/RseB C-terminal domain-containing protein [Burkholderiales bacterium]
MGKAGPGAGRRLVMGMWLAAGLLAASAARAEDAAQWLARVTHAARTLNYSGTVVLQSPTRTDTFRLSHLNENGQEWEKLLSLDGPAREIVRTGTEVRYYFPDAKVVLFEPRTFRNVFPSLSTETIRNLTQYYDFKTIGGDRVAGINADVVVFEPRDGLRYGHKFWSDAATGLLLKARLINERGDVVEQFSFTDVTVNAKVDKDMVKPSWATVPADWRVRQSGPGEVELKDTGWLVGKVPPGFAKISEGFRKLPGKPNPVAHIVYSDGLVAISIFVEPFTVTQTQVGLTQTGGLAQYTTRSDAALVTVMGEAPPATVRQIAQSVARSPK